MNKADIGLIGLAVMGENLVLNMESHGFTVAVYNRTTSKVDDFVNGRGSGKNIIGTHSVEQLCANLERPRRVMIMVKAGAAVDKVIESLLPYLEEGDIVIDGGNSQYQDSTRRTAELSEKGLQFIGTGDSFFIGPPEERWDLVLLVRQASVRSFLAMAQNTDYLAGLGHRMAALEDSRLLPLVEPDEAA
mgnify:CR=1 FL=1